jgi:hypothetical protein
MAPLLRMKSGPNTDDIPRLAGGRPVPALTGHVPPIARTGSSPLRPHLCSIRLSAVLLLTALGLGAVAQAETFYLTRRMVEVPEAGRVTNAVLSSSRHELDFLPPQGWKENFDTNNLQLTWTSRDYASLLRLKISPTWPMPEIKPDALREAAQARHPKARIVEQFTCYTAAGPGIAFDLEETADGQIRTSTRLAFVPYEAGLAEFTFVTPADQFPKGQQLFGQFLNSFHVQPRLRP